MFVTVSFYNLVLREVYHKTTSFAILVQKWTLARTSSSKLTVFFPQILIAIPAKARANNPMVTNANFMFQLLYKGTKYLAKGRVV